MRDRMMAWTAMLTLATGCPHTWGKEGYIQRLAYENAKKDQVDTLPCDLTSEEWMELCGEEIDHKGTCPRNCPLPAELKK